MFGRLGVPGGSRPRPRCSTARFRGRMVPLESLRGETLIATRHLIVAACALACLPATGDRMARADGAFAFGKSGHTWSSGSAYNYATAEEASKLAMTRCRSRKEAPDACKIIATIPTTNGRCFAIAIQQDDNGYGWSTAGSVPDAEKRAMERCEGYGKSCAVRSSFCDAGATTTTYSGSLPPIAAAPVSAPAPKPTAVPAPSAVPSVNTGGGSPACQKFPDLC